MTSVLIGGGLALGAAALSGYFGSKSAEEQAAASAAALREQELARQEARDFAAKQSAIATGQIRDYGDQAQESLRTSGESALGTLKEGQEESRGITIAGGGKQLGALEEGAAAARAGLIEGQAGSESALAAGLAGAEGQIGAGLSGAQSSLSQLTRGGFQAADVLGTRSRLGELADRGFSAEQLAQDPGYQFRLQQGERAINRAAAARGGRNSGRTLKELAQFGQGLASEEFDKSAQRQLALAGGADAQQIQLALNQAGRTDAASLAAQQQRAGALGQIAGLQYGAGSQLGGLSAQQGQFLAEQRMRTGAGLSGLESQLGGQRAGVYGQTYGSLANLASQGSQQQANLQAQTGSNLAQLQAAQGNALGNVAIGQAAQNAQLTQSMLPLYGAGTQYAGAGTAAWGNAANAGLSNLGYLAQLYGGDK